MAPVRIETGASPFLRNPLCNENSQTAFAVSRLRGKFLPSLPFNFYNFDFYNYDNEVIT